MKYLLFLLLVVSSSCSEKKVTARETELEISSRPPYDTVPIDSFSAGATSVDIAAQIRKSSLKYQDSLKKAKAAATQAEQLKKAQEAEAKKQQKNKTSSENSEPKTTPTNEVKNEL